MPPSWNYAREPLMPYGQPITKPSNHTLPVSQCEAKLRKPRPYIKQEFKSLCYSYANAILLTLDELKEQKKRGLGPSYALESFGMKPLPGVRVTMLRVLFQRNA